MPSDFISQFMLFTEGTRSPELFRLWSAISLIAGALEQRVWIENGDDIAYANLYVLLVAPPGVGKDIIERVRDLWMETTAPNRLEPSLHVAPDNMTKAALVDHIEKSKRIFTPESGKAPPLVYHSLSVAAEEFSVFLPAYDMEFIGVLNTFWGKKKIHIEERRFNKKDTRIDRPQLNILGGIQPSYMASLFPEEAWNTGLARRLMMIYSTDTPHRGLFQKSSTPKGLRDDLLAALGEMSMAYGPMKWEEEAMLTLDRWHMEGPPNAGGPPLPTHQKLQHYLRSRSLLSLKLSMIAAMSRDRNALTIGLGDVKRALHWMIEAEKVMPDIFRAMVGKSDTDVLREIHYFTLQQYGRSRKAVSGMALRRFLLERVPHDKLEGLIRAAESSGLIARVAGTGQGTGTADEWMPRAKEHGGGEGE